MAKPLTVARGWARWLTQNPGEWPLRRLFWSGPVPQPADADDPESVIATLTTILEEGTAKDWRTIRWDAVRPLWTQLPLDPRLCQFWNAYHEEEYAINHRDHVLDAEQHHVLQIAATVLPDYGFELAGGTALATGYLGHRLSDDLDIFTGDPTIKDAVPTVEAAWRHAGIPVHIEISYATFTRFWVGARPMKVELAQDRPYRLAASTLTVDGMPTRSLQDLAADKTLALFGRATTRDFVDVYFLLQRYELSQLMAWAAEKDPGFDRDWFIRAIVQAQRVQPKQVTMLVPLDWDHLRLTFRQAALRLDRESRESDADHER